MGIRRTYSKPPAAKGTVESSIYVHPHRHRQGIGRQLLLTLIRALTRGGFHSMVAEILDQPARIALHRSLGFAEAGRIREAGYKLGRWIDVVLMQRMLEDQPDARPTPDGD